MHVVDDGGVVETVKKYRSGNVVRQVADDAQRGTRGERGEIDSQYIGADDVEFADAARFFAQWFDQVAIEFDRRHAPGRAQQRQCQRTFARTDFDDALAALRRNQFDDAAQNALVMQEVLTEPFAWDV